MSNDPVLSAFDVASLAKDPSPQARVEVGAKVAARFDNALITHRERELAHQILALLVQDTAEMVRESLARSLCQMPGAPKDIVAALAADIDEVARPVLEASPIFDDEALIAIVNSGSRAKQMSIASRPAVSPKVSDALVSTDNRDVVLCLTSNVGASFWEGTLATVAELYADDEAIATTLVKRADLPVTVVERLVTAVSDELRSYLIEHHNISAELADRVTKDSRERTTVDLVEGVESKNIPKLVAQLATSGRLTSSLLLRAVCLGEMRFAEAIFVQMTGLPEPKVWSLMHDKGPLGFKALFARARLPQVLYPAFRTAIDIYQEMDYTGAASDRYSFRLRMLERLLTSYEGLDGEDLDFLLSRMARISDKVHDDMEIAEAV
jgi:uncharacterized protein (DUF2336 family)